MALYFPLDTAIGFPSVALWLIVRAPAPWIGGLGLATILAACTFALSGLEDPPRALVARRVPGRVGA